MILSEAQVRALYQAMMHCNDVDASFSFRVVVGNSVVTVEEAPDSWEVFVRIEDGTIVERYESQVEFASAYGVTAYGV